MIVELDFLGFDAARGDYQGRMRKLRYEVGEAISIEMANAHAALGGRLIGLRCGKFYVILEQRGPGPADIWHPYTTWHPLIRQLED